MDVEEKATRYVATVFSSWAPSTTVLAPPETTDCSTDSHLTPDVAPILVASDDRTDASVYAIDRNAAPRVS
jgi:hypothetical protein